MSLPRSVVMVVLVSVIGCGDAGGGPPVVLTDSAGIAIVTSPGEDRPLDWQFDERFRLGGEESGPESFYAVNVLNVGVDARNRIHVLDSRARNVLVFDSAGAFVRAFGGSGEGPGELSGPASLAVGGDGTVSVFDWGKGALVRWDSTGGVIAEMRFQRFPQPVLQRHFASVGDQVFVVTGGAPGPESQRRAVLLRLGPADSAQLAEVIQPGSEMVIYPECGGGLNLPPLFTPEIAWDIRSDRLAVSATSAYRVDVLLVAPDSEIPGAPVRVTMVRSLRRAIEPRDATRDLAIQELGEGFRINFGRGPCTIPPDRMVDGRGYASTIPWVRRIAVAPDGAVWIERRMIGRDSAGPIDVFDADGAYVGTLAAGSPFPIVFLRPDRIAYALTDEMDVDRLVVADVVKR